MSRIPLHDVIAQNRSVQAELDEAWNAVSKSGIFVSGPQVKLFEEQFATYIGASQCIGVGNATDGFEIAFQALGLNTGDEIIIPANAHVSPALAALKVGLKPVFCDVDESRMLLNAHTVSAQVSDKTKAIVAVHLYGRVCPMEELQTLCSDHNLILIEDFSQAHGASYKGQKVGSFGDASVCSFYPTKPLGALGDGGAILTSNSEIEKRCRAFANYGWKNRDNTVVSGQNSRLDELQASLLNVKLKYLDQWNAERLLKGKELQSQLNGFDRASVAKFLDGDVCHLMVIRSETRDELMMHVTENGVDCQVHYPIPIHKQKFFNSNQSLPISEQLAREVLSVPTRDALVQLLEGFN